MSEINIRGSNGTTKICSSLEEKCMNCVARVRSCAWLIAKEKSPRNSTKDLTYFSMDTKVGYAEAIKTGV